MASIRTRKETGQLYFDFRYRGIRCREQTTEIDTPTNRLRLGTILKRITKDIRSGNFSYRAYFPNSPRAALFEQPAPILAPLNVSKIAEALAQDQKLPATSAAFVEKSRQGTIVQTTLTPLFPEFAYQWAKEREPEWKRSTQIKVADILNGHLISHFRGRVVGDITKQDILNLRTHLAKDYRDGKGLSPARINGILNILRQILEEAADRFQFTTPYRGIKALRVPRTEVEPLSIGEVRQFLAAVPQQYQVLYTVAFFTGLRTSELLGLKWEHVDFPHAQIHIRETWVYGAEDTPKTDRSQRSVSMHSVVLTALRQHRTDNLDNPSPFVFPNAAGRPLSHHNLANRIWNPTLKALGLKPRRPYQTRHTAATLWLSSGESPEWIASQLGHSSTKMLFTVYSQYVPNATRQDGSAFERLLQQSEIVTQVTHPTSAANDAATTLSEKETSNG